MTATSGRGGASSSSAPAIINDPKKVGFNVLLDDAVIEDEDISLSTGEGKDQQPKEESLEQLMAARVVSPTASMEDDAEWATATSKHGAKNKKPARPIYNSNNTSTSQGNYNNRSNPQQQYNHSNPHHPQGQRPAKEPVALSEESTLEFYDFPASFRTQDLKAALSAFEVTGRYRLKWNNDTSCWFVFGSEADRDRALQCVQEYIAAQADDGRLKVRIYNPANYQ